ncbi:DUF262 domain-containing protein [Pantoea sp. Al-1710]|uniref:DUF262 domain-containing protein n=1 Tax=Candidatus Pantoea communis TaxID=2608354 RepID=A0ABX0S036_9GAMM|nr:DUF262 domain-containing protein [Pantoea communis]NIG22166.1 DUF262 domain-containing protein [Pantoea communis]
MMSSNITPKLVQTLFEMYQKEILTVNRRYQRKLVWSLAEKEKFIDSLVNGYPIPLIITSKQNNDSTKIEILDGLQRLNAITSFIECEYSLNGHYFNLDSITLTKQLKENGALSQKEPVLSSENCSRLLNYEVPFSTSSSNTNEFIDETFRRINTGGRTLSKQDVRQAGSLGLIPDTINKIASYIRKDSSRTDVVTLRGMKNISISDDDLNYGINIKDIFWVKNNIILKEDVKKSRDEELIAHLLSYALLKDKSHTTSYYLDRLYDHSSDESQLLSQEIYKYSQDYIIKTFNHVFDEMQTIYKDDRDNFSESVYGNGKKIKSALSFQVVFLAIYELIIIKGKRINNYKNLHTSLCGAYDKHYQNILSKDKKWSNTDRHSLIKSTIGVIEDNFSNSKDGTFEPGGWIKNLENIINESKTESNYYDYKAGLVTTSPLSDSINLQLVDKIIKTLSAMTNTYTGECMVIVGVAENIEGAKNHQAAFGKSYIKYSDVYITGIDSEAMYISDSVDSYIKKIKDLLKNSTKATKAFLESIVQNSVNFTYKDKEILILIAKRGQSPTPFDGKYYVRNFSHNAEVPIGSDEFNDLFIKFASNKP